MNLKYMFLAVSLIVSAVCFASQPAFKFHEEIIERDDEDETEINTHLCASSKENAEQVARLTYTFKKESERGVIDIIEVYKGFQNAGLGTALFKRAIVELMVYNPKTICWEALPLENAFSRKKLASLVQLYKRLGGVIIKENINDKNNNVEMQYPMALAQALSILHPIFFAQEQSLVLQKQKDPFALIVAYANIDLKNTDLKEVK